ncbi:MAG: hypothetical protein JSS91_02200 [Bacteroidetes bacterium]|nr:hypothetical protein [Bacteroidota bacterium]
MLKSSLLEILRTFTKPELIKFGDFVRSPYFNKKENVTKLFLEIKKYAPEFSDENLAKEKIWVKVFPGKEYNYGIMKNLIHDLSKLSESFITNEYTKSQKLRNNTDLLAALLERHITKVFLSKYDIVEKSYDVLVFKNESFRINEFYDSMNKLNYLKAMYNKLYVPASAPFDSISESGIYFIYTVIVNSYKNYNNYLALNDKEIIDKDNINEMFMTGLNKYIITELLDKVKSKSGRDYLILKCFYEINVSLSSEADISDYFSFKKSLEDCTDILSKNDLRDLLTCLSNSLHNIREGKTNTGINSNKEMMEIYNMEIDNNVFLWQNGLMAQNAYMSYIITAFTLREYESIEKLRTKFRNKIPEDKRENVDLYCLAHISFGKKEFNKSLEYLSMIDHDFFNMKHLIKDIQMMNYYELSDYISFSYTLDSYRHFVSKNKSVKPHNKSLSEVFCSNINKLFKLRESFDLYELGKFRKEIEENKLINKYWILDKISEIESGNKKVKS